MRNEDDHTVLALFTPAMNPADPALLFGMRCSCGHVAYPRQRFGCERCGLIDGSTDVDLVARGTVTASATVHLQMNPAPPVPFSVGAVKLVDGPMVRALIHADLEPGQVAHGVVDFGRSDGVMALSFVPAQFDSEADGRG